MPNYRVTKTSYIENLSIKILNELGIFTKRNNTANTTAVDLVTDINSIKIDVQYSQNFAQWGDLRYDFVSAYSKGIRGKEYSSIDIFKKFESIYGLKVDKVGKYYQKDYLDAIIVLFYNQTLEIINPTKDYMPDKILLVTKDEIVRYVDNNLNELLEKTKLNNKEGLGDLHGSAFLPIKVSKLIESTNCYFDTIENLKNKSNEIKKYLGYKKI
ncbi:hypothetical protein CCY99_05305 [Helicobacter sp. 16-1353]|uniref:hypothetical protein n=1 Tax=Helicobacter sp. 16-1353 TaxID=2004996 RepID=UPI000DCD53D6|nr:hypothetical protein [Helicobacter sp. 16-1353]RAX54097.1 hypothetical protein CCY99_05305 [Helicobacter sp. 16-1353]